jgi:ABC-type sugar transport system substrate-binding protein
MFCSKYERRRKMKRRIFLTLALIVTLLPMAGLANAAPPAQEEVTYTVQKDDNLWMLAEKYLGSGPAYRAIVMATNAKHEEDETFAQIVNPNIIQPGWKVLIPAPAEAEELVATAKPIIVLALDSDIDHIEPMEFRSDAGYYATANFYEPWRAHWSMVPAWPNPSPSPRTDCWPL